MVVTKSISRFARNTLDTLKYVRMLKEKGIAVFFEEENINTLTMDGELLLVILSCTASLGLIAQVLKFLCDDGATGPLNIAAENIAHDLRFFLIDSDCLVFISEITMNLSYPKKSLKKRRKF